MNILSSNNLILMNSQSADDWRIVNDGVMGGLSSSQMHLTDEGVIEFTGEVSLENNGGFASIRSTLKEYDFSDYSGIKLKVKGDGKTYSISMKQTYNFTGYFYTTNFETKNNEWIEVDLPFDRFSLKYFGRTIEENPDMPLENIKEVSLLIGEKQEGQFKIVIDKIALY